MLVPFGWTVGIYDRTTIVLNIIMLFGLADLSESSIYFSDFSPHMSVHERVDKRVNSGVAVSESLGKDAANSINSKKQPQPFFGSD